MAEPDVSTLIADLKMTVVLGHMRQIMEHLEVLRDSAANFAYLKEKIDEIHVEVVKHKNTEMLEMLGLDSIAAIHEKYQEAKVDQEVAWKDWLLAGIGGAVLLVLIPALALLFKGQMVNLWRLAQTRGDDNRRVLTGDGNGGYRRERLRDVNAREQRVFNGGTSLADLVGNPTNVEQTRKLREELEKLNPEVLKFNNRAPAFIQDFGRLPSEAKANKAVKAVDAIAAAMGRINQAALATFAGNIGKIADRLSKADPLHIGKVAEAIGKLVLAAKDLKPEMIPQARRVQDSATAVGNLARETGTLRTKFAELRGTVQSLDQQLGGA
ncbi:hypothetical protein ABZ572_25890 [Streptomyces sp. NPDC018338]|uniref:hypothetical protein n=1 Tax=Streptomyces sp. NPDC018338 TaxID=3157192 RepID=UPI0034094E97